MKRVIVCIELLTGLSRGCGGGSHAHVVCDVFSLQLDGKHAHPIASTSVVLFA